MVTDGIQGLRKRRFRRTTDSQHGLPIAKNLLARAFSRAAPNVAWVSDITYLRTDEGWLYLAATLDLHSRRVVGWALEAHMGASLAVDAFKMAVDIRQPEAGLLHHSDRGVQYASADFQRALSEAGATCSMSRKGNCWDNAVAESFFGRLKNELVRRTRWTTRTLARAAVTEYIRSFYNAKRRHSALGYLSPMEYELNTRRVIPPS